MQSIVLKIRKEAFEPFLVYAVRNRIEHEPSNSKRDDEFLRVVIKPLTLSELCDFFYSLGQGGIWYDFLNGAQIPVARTERTAAPTPRGAAFCGDKSPSQPASSCSVYSQEQLFNDDLC